VKCRVLVLRPEPGAGATAARARAMGLRPVVAPLFTIRPVAWDAPQPDAFDAVLLTSANAARHAGAGLSGFLHLPCRAVGEATAAAARAAGFARISTGDGDGAAALAPLAGRVLHPCGRDHVPLPQTETRIERRVVYAADASRALPDAARQALAAGAIAIVHSPRAAATFAALVDAGGLARHEVVAAAISEAAAAALGDGWAAIGVAARPRDEALLELAAQLCQKMARRRE
jgi:uroporphyrinogen-III synthase